MRRTELRKRGVRYRCLEGCGRLPNLEEARAHVQWDKHTVAIEWVLYQELTP